MVDYQGRLLLCTPDTNVSVCTSVSSVSWPTTKRHWGTFNSSFAEDSSRRSGRKCRLRIELYSVQQWQEMPSRHSINHLLKTDKIIILFLSNFSPKMSLPIYEQSCLLARHRPRLKPPHKGRPLREEMIVINLINRKWRLRGIPSMSNGIQFAFLYLFTEIRNSLTL